MNVKEGLIYRCNKSSKPKVPFLITSESIGDLSSMVNIDIISLRDINLKFEDRTKLLRGIGLEITISNLRLTDGKQLGKWIADISSFYAYCKHARFQFILSSGATSICELVSGRCFDSLLKTCGIDPISYWNDLNGWLQTRLIRRHTYFA